jgi:hypothetical protein
MNANKNGLRKDLSYVASLSKELDDSPQSYDDEQDIQNASSDSLSQFMDVDTDQQDDDLEDDFLSSAIGQSLPQNFLSSTFEDDEINVSELLTTLNRLYQSYPVSQRLHIPLRVSGEGTHIVNVRSTSDEVIITLG